MGFVFASGVIKPSVIVYAFGPPRNDGSHPAGLMKHGVAALAAILATAQVVADVLHILVFAQSSNLSWWYRWNGMAYGICISSNVQTAVALEGFYNSYRLTWAWRKARGIMPVETVRDLILLTQGRLWWFFFIFMHEVYYNIVVSLIWVFCGLGYLAYFWLWGFVFFCLNIVSAKVMMIITKHMTLPEEEQMKEAPKNAGEQNEFMLRMLEFRDSVQCAAPGYCCINDTRKIPYDIETYKLDQETFEKTGVTFAAWSGLLTTPATAAIHAIVGPTVIWFYLSSAYVWSMSFAWDDRSTMSFMQSLISNTILRWTQLVNYLF